MTVFKPAVLGLALLLSSTALWSALVTGSMSLTSALIRFLIAIPVATVMLLLIKAVTDAYQRPPAEPDPLAAEEKQLR